MRINQQGIVFRRAERTQDRVGNNEFVELGIGDVYFSIAITFSSDMNYPLIPVDVLMLDGNQFADSNTGGKEQFLRPGV